MHFSSTQPSHHGWAIDVCYLIGRGLLSAMSAAASRWMSSDSVELPPADVWWSPAIQGFTSWIL